MNPLKSLSLTILLGALLSGCGRPNTIYSDGDAVVSSGTTITLPSGFLDQSVNHASIPTYFDFGLTPSLKFEIIGGTSTAGAFNDASATGNRAILGIQKYDQTALADFSLSVTSASETSSALRVSLLVDLDCDGTTLRTFESSKLAVGPSTASTTDPIWSVDGAALKDSSNNVLVASTADSSPSSLTAFLTAHPKACLKSGHSDASDAPTTTVASLLLSIGSGSSTAMESLTVSSLTIKGDTYDHWGKP